MQASKSTCLAMDAQRLRMCLLIFIAGIGVGWAQPQAQRYVCSPCGLPCDTKYFDKPGICPACGMPLVSEQEAKAVAAKAEQMKKVAVLIFDGVEVIDFTGPYEMFGAANFDVYTVARTKEPITTAMGLTVTPKYSFDDVPLPDVLVIPGGEVKATQGDSTTLKWIADESARIGHTMSVCNGAFILASAGLLDGLSATTTNGNLQRLKDQFPKVHVVNDQRYVGNGKIITAAGLSAGIDGALHVIALLKGEGYAEQIALIEEYRWSPHTAFVRAALADQLIPNVDIAPAYGQWDIVSTEGDTDQWKLVLHGTSDSSSVSLRSYFERILADVGKWKKTGSDAQGTSNWQIRKPTGALWRGSLAVQENPERSHQFTVTVRITKKSPPRAGNS